MALKLRRYIYTAKPEASVLGQQENQLSQEKEPHSPPWATAPPTEGPITGPQEEQQLTGWAEKSILLPTSP